VGHDDAQGLLAEVRGWAERLFIAGPAVAAFVLGALVLARVIDRTGVVPGTALALIVAGLGLLAAYRPPRAAPRANEVAGWLLMVFSCAVAYQHVTGTSLALDAGGRMPPPTTLASFLAGLVLVAIRRPTHIAAALAVQVLIGVILTIAAVSLIASDVASEGLLPWYRYSRMAVTTSFAFMGLAVGMMVLVARSAWYEALYARREDEKILVVALGILVLVAIAISAAGFVTMQKNLERAVERGLAQAAADRVAILENLISNRVLRAATIGSRADVRRTLAGRSDTPAARKELTEEGAAYLGLGFRGVAFEDANGRPVASAGFILPAAKFDVPLGGQRSPANLAWDEAYVLRTRTPVIVEGRTVGTVSADQSLELLSRLQAQVGALGDTAEWVLCAPAASGMACFPQRFAPYPRTDARVRGGEAVPMDYALKGEAGVISAKDYRGVRVIAAYAPVGATGLGVVLKVDSDEVYAPLRTQLGLWWRWFWGLAIVGALLLASQMRPIARRLVQSEQVARERAEELARSERTLRGIYANLADGIVVLRPDGVIDFMNPAAERLFGFAPGAGVGVPVANLVPEALRESNVAATQRYLAAGTSNVLDRPGLVYPALRQDGSRFDAEFSLAQSGHADERRLVAVVRDVSERTKLARMKSDFIAAVSHELRTPLTSIMGSLEMMRESEPLPQPQADFLDMAWRNSNRLKALVDDVIDAERIDSGALKFEEEPLDIAALLRDSVQMNQPYAGARGVLLWIEEPLPQARVTADRGRVLQVMANLLSNAAKFSPAGARVDVRARVAGKRVHVEVQDRGSGIPDEFRPRVFERFAQAQSSDAGRHAGTGLGLAISKSIVERMGGAIGFDSQLGAGTTFWFELPLAS
jgi:PAS domain S-box-containing protein